MDRFTEVYKMYYHKVRRFLFSLAGNAEQADELTQEVFYRAFLHIGQYTEQGNMYAWLCTIGKNVWLNECRKQTRYILTEEFSDIRDLSKEPEGMLLKKERQKILRKAIWELSEDYRDVIILHIYGGIPLREISTIKGKSESWGKVTFYRAKQILAQKLEELDDEYKM